MGKKKHKKEKMKKSDEYIFKFVTMGEYGVGKSSLLTQFPGQKLSHRLTNDVQLVRQIINIDYKPDIKFKLRIWDMGHYVHYEERIGIRSSRRRYRKRPENYTYSRRNIDKDDDVGFIDIPRFPYKGAVGALLVYDITRRETFDVLASWVEVLRQHGNANMIITLVGNKCDLSDLRVVSTEEGENFAKEHDLLFVETSAETAKNVKKAFSKTAVTLYKKIQDKEAFIKTVATEYEKIQDEEDAAELDDRDDGFDTDDADDPDYKFIQNFYANSVDLISYRPQKQESKMENPEKEIEKLQRERSELKKAVKERNEFIQEMFEDCQALLLEENESEQVAKGANRGEDILGADATITNTTYEDEY